MDEAGDNPLREDAATLGARLAAERERQGLSRADVAHRLHMSPIQVEALELGDYGHLPKGTFLRGFVRNYAKALGLAAEPLLEMLAGAAPAVPAPGIVVPTQNIRFDPLGERLSSPYVKAATLAAVAIAIGFAAMYWAMYVRPRPPALALRAGRAPAPAATQPAAVPPPRESSNAVPPSHSIAEAPSQSPPASPGGSGGASSTAPAAMSAAPAPAAGLAKPKATPAKAAATKAPPASADDAKVASADSTAASRRLHFHFTGDSWVEVRDASGKVLFQKLNAAGTEAQVSGHAPLQVVVGNAPEVEMTLDGKPFDLDPHTEVAVARFTLE